MSRDFFDDDLVGAKDDMHGIQPDSDDGLKEISAESLSRLVSQREERSHKAADAAEQIERMRQRQHELEKERQRLEALSGKQDRYESGKRGIVSKLERSLVLTEKQIAEASAAIEVMSAVRQRFGDTLEGLNAINEEEWAEDAFEVDLDRALASVEEAQTTYEKGMAKLGASDWFRGGAATTVAGGVAPLQPEPRGFLFWLRAGLAFSLPVIVVILTCFLTFLQLSGFLVP